MKFTGGPSSATAGESGASSITSALSSFGRPLPNRSSKQFTPKLIRIGHISKYWGPYAFNIAASRIETFQWPTAESFPNAASTDNSLSIRKLPTFEFNSRDQQVADGPLPLYVSWDANFSFLHRQERPS